MAAGRVEVLVDVDLACYPAHRTLIARSRPVNWENALRWTGFSLCPFDEEDRQ
jgi:hypothetical protein